MPEESPFELKKTARCIGVILDTGLAMTTHIKDSCQGDANGNEHIVEHAEGKRDHRGYAMASYHRGRIYCFS